LLEKSSALREGRPLFVIFGAAYEEAKKRYGMEFFRKPRTKFEKKAVREPDGQSDSAARAAGIDLEAFARLRKEAGGEGEAGGGAEGRKGLAGAVGRREERARRGSRGSATENPLRVGRGRSAARAVTRAVLPPAAGSTNDE
jgi:hypothetical protein